MTSLIAALVAGALFHISVIQSLIVRRQYHDGILYENYAAESDNIRYAITGATGWDNLDTLVESHGLTGKAMFCSRGPGAWLLYPSDSFGFGERNQLKLLYGEYCVPLDNINSLQPLGGLYTTAFDKSTVITFSKTHFGSEAKPTFRDGDGQEPVKSMIFLGNAKWTVDDGAGSSICVTALGMDGDLCLLEDVESAFSTSTQVMVKKGCENETMDVYRLQSCYSPGYHSITYEIDFNLASMNEICSGNGSSDLTKDKFVKVVKIWKYRLKPKSKDRPSLKPKTELKYRILNNMAETMQRSCPALAPLYLHLLVEIYFSLHAKNGEIWSGDLESDGARLGKKSQWVVANEFMSMCFNQTRGENILEFEIGCTPQKISDTMLDKEIETIEDFLKGDSFDFVIEQIWLMLNYVTPYCSYLFGFSDNYWSEFPLLMKKELLYPLREQWKNPGKWVTYYPLMFNGFDLELEKRNMISCVQKIIMITPSYDPLARPPGFLTSKDASVKDIIVKGTTNTTKENGDGKRRKRQRVTGADSEELANNHEMPMPKQTMVRDTAKNQAPAQTTLTEDTGTPEKSTPDDMSYVPPWVINTSPDESATEKPKHLKKGRRLRRKGKRRHSKLQKSEGEIINPT